MSTSDPTVASAHASDPTVAAARASDPSVGSARASDPTVAGVSSLRAGQDVVGVFACSRKDRLMTRNGSPYLVLELRDRSGAVAARAFQNADALGGGLSGAK
ncbi:MAG: hypothetical protein M3016_08265 [Actinomycetota bacterium]|nr:hypothetical protein [Actinomycetota bacterium]